MLTRFLLIATTCVVTATVTSAQAPSARPPAALSGDWRSEPRVNGRPDVQLVVSAESTLTARMVLRGETRNVSEWAPLTVEHLAWDGRRITFSTALPHDEGTAYWTFTPTGPTTARIAAVTDDAEPGDEMPAWNVVKRRN